MNNPDQLLARMLEQVLELPAADREEATVEFVSAALAIMEETTVCAFRRAVWQHRCADSVIDLIDGNLALREIFRPRSCRW